MLPGPLIVLRCPSCGGGNLLRTMASGNPFGAEYWSDGKYVTPMFRQDPWLVKCPHCSSCFWLADAKVDGEFLKSVPELEIPTFLRRPNDALSEWFAKIPAFAPLPEDQRSVGAASFHETTEADMLSVLSQQLPPIRERYVRFKIWCDINDKYRDSTCLDPVRFSPEQEENLQRLNGILDDARPTDWLLKAEIHRELGEFRAALDI